MKKRMTKAEMETAKFDVTSYNADFNFLVAITGITIVLITVVIYAVLTYFS